MPGRGLSVLLVLLAVAAGACGPQPSSSSPSERTPLAIPSVFTPPPGAPTYVPPTAAPTPLAAAPACAATLDAVPFRTHIPFERKALAALDYLNAGGRPDALRAALTCWGNIGNAPPGDFPYGAVEEVDLTADGTPELVVAMGDSDSKQRFPPGRVLIFERSGPTHAIRFDSDTLKLGRFAGAPALLPLIDRNGDGAADLAYTGRYLGANTGSLEVVVVGRSGPAAPFDALLETGMNFGRLTIDQRPDGTSSFVLTGGPISGNYGPPRDRRVTYAWDGQKFAKESDVPAEPRDQWDDLWVAYDADEAAKAGRYDEAIEGYRYLEGRAIASGANARAADLRTYARFRLILAYLATGDRAPANALAPTFTSTAAQQATPGSALAFGAAFMASYQVDGNVAKACAATIGDGAIFDRQTVMANRSSWPEDFRALVVLSYFNYKPKDFCPFG